MALVEMREVAKSFGGLRAVDGVSLDLRAGEVVAVVGHNGAGKSTLMKMLAGAYARDGGSIRVDGREAPLASPAEAQALGIETTHQTQALADNLDAVANLFLGREVAWRVGPFRVMDRGAMREAASRVIGRLNPRFAALDVPVRELSGGQRQTVAIARAIQFRARILVMDEPTAALGPEETAMVGELIGSLKAEGLGIFLISHDIEDVFGLADRIAVMKGGRIVGTAPTDAVTREEVLGMIILGRCPPGATPGPGAVGP